MFLTRLLLFARFSFSVLDDTANGLFEYLKEQTQFGGPSLEIFNSELRTRSNATAKLFYDPSTFLASFDKDVRPLSLFSLPFSNPSYLRASSHSSLSILISPPLSSFLSSSHSLFFYISRTRGESFGALPRPSTPRPSPKLSSSRSPRPSTERSCPSSSTPQSRAVQILPIVCHLQLSFFAPRGP